MAAYGGMKEMHLGVDNFAAVWAVLNRRLKIHHRDTAMVVRRIQQALRWSGMALRLTYAPPPPPSGIQPTPFPEFLSSPAAFGV